MKKWRRESILDVYNLVLAAFLFISPWLFAQANGTAAADLRISGAAVTFFAALELWLVYDETHPESQPPELEQKH